MPDSRSIGTPRNPIDRSGGAIGNSPISNTGGITRGNVSTGRSITDVAPPAPISAVDYNTILANIRNANLAQYIDVPWNTMFPRAGNPVAGASPNTGVPIPQNPFETLADVFSKAFGNAQYNPPLQNQAYGYTPVSSGGSGIGTFLLIGGLGVGAYFLYKRFKG